MGKLSAFLAQRKDLEFDFEREVRAVCDLLRGVQLIGGREQTLSLMPGEGFVAEGQARAILVLDLQISMREVLIRYLHNLCFEGGRLGLEPAIFEDALRLDHPRESEGPASGMQPTATITPISGINSEAARQLQEELSAAQAAA